MWVFNKFQLEAEMFKTFKLDDDPNYTIRIIYKKGKEKEKSDLMEPFKD